MLIFRRNMMNQPKWRLIPIQLDCFIIHIVFLIVILLSAIFRHKWHWIWDESRNKRISAWVLPAIRNRCSHDSCIWLVFEAFNLIDFKYFAARSGNHEVLPVFAVLTVNFIFSEVFCQCVENCAIMYLGLWRLAKGGCREFVFWQEISSEPTIKPYFGVTTVHRRPFGDSTPVSAYSVLPGIAGG